jgi:hypothetical protein
MVEIAFEVAANDPIYEDLAASYAGDLLLIARAMNRMGPEGMWDEEDGFYYDVLRLPDGSATRLKVRSMVDLLPLCATTVVDARQRERTPKLTELMFEYMQRMPVSRCMQPGQGRRANRHAIPANQRVSSSWRTPMRTKPVLYDDDSHGFDARATSTGASAGVARRIGARLLHEASEALPPTIFFFIGFNFVVFTTNLLVAEYAVAVSNFMLATFAALVVGKAVLVANAIPLLKRYDRAPLIQPILFKTAFYWVIVFLARLLERFVHFSIIEGNSPGDFFPYLITTFSWHRFSAISLWILVLFLIYVTATEFGHLFGSNELRRLFFTSRPSELQLNRRQRLRELLRLSRLADAHSRDELRDPTSAPHREMVEIMERLSRQNE